MSGFCWFSVRGWIAACHLLVLLQWVCGGGIKMSWVWRENSLCGPPVAPALSTSLDFSTGKLWLFRHLWWPEALWHEFTWEHSINGGSIKTLKGCRWKNYSTSFESLKTDYWKNKKWHWLSKWTTAASNLATRSDSLKSCALYW